MTPAYQIAVWAVAGLGTLLMVSWSVIGFFGMRTFSSMDNKFSSMDAKFSRVEESLRKLADAFVNVQVERARDGERINQHDKALEMLRDFPSRVDLLEVQIKELYNVAQLLHPNRKR